MGDNCEENLTKLRNFIMIKIPQEDLTFQKFDSENLTSSVPQISGSIVNPVISFQEVPKNKLSVDGRDPNLLQTDDQSEKSNEESEIEREIRLSHEKQQILQLEKKEREEEKRKSEGEQQRRLVEIEKENQRIEKEMEEEQVRIKKEQDDRKKEEEKQKGEIESIGKWKLTKAPDFEGNIFEAAAKGKLTSIIYLLANGTNVNERFQSSYYHGWYMTNSTPIHFAAFKGHTNVVEYLLNQEADLNAKDSNAALIYLVKLLFIMLLQMVILVLLNI